MKRRKMFHKIMYAMIMLVFMFMVSFSSYSIVARGSDEVFISGINWYSNSDTVGYWKNEPKVFYNSLSASFSAMSELNFAVNSWSNGGIISSITTTPTNADIKFYAGTRAQLNTLGLTYSSSTLGLTNTNYSWVGYVNGLTHDLVENSYAIASTCSEAEEYVRRVTVHEYGHALGWYGHSDDEEDVMYRAGNISQSAILSNAEKEYLYSVYEAVEEYYSEN